jgi:hypothetical protein
MPNARGRIVVVLRQQFAKKLAAKLGAADIKDLRDAVVALEADGAPLKKVLEQPEFQSITSFVPNETRSLRDQIALESSYKTPPHQTLVGVFAVNASKLDDADREQLVAKLEALPIVAQAYEESSKPSTAGGGSAANVGQEQTYLNAAPQGIGLKALPANKYPDGTGVGLGVVDMAWNLKHETLTKVSVEPRGGNGQPIVPSQLQHGTAALGLILSPHNKPLIGIAPGADVKVLITPDADDPDLATNPTAEAIRKAAKKLVEGDVLLIEIQETEDRPVEVNVDTFIAIQEASSNGIIVIEPAGDKGVDLDGYTKKTAPAWHNPDYPNHDSGAIMVSGCTLDAPHHPDATGCNHGSRVDCYAPSIDVVSAGWDSLVDSGNENTSYGKGDFNSTSAASAIIAGVVLRIQALARETDGIKRSLNSLEIRALLRRPEFGTPIVGDERFMPNLAKLPAVLAIFASSIKPGPTPPAATVAVP